MFAFVRWWKHGGYLIVRKSRYGWFPHFLWSAEAPEYAESFVPINPKKRLFPPLFFRGRVKVGDE